MPQPFDHPSVRHMSTDDRSFDELRRDAELGLDALKQALARTKQAGPDQQTQWAVTRLRTTVERLGKVKGGDVVITNRLIAETAQLESQIKAAEKAFLLSRGPTGGDGAAGQRAGSSDEDPLADPDEERARLLRAQQLSHASDRMIEEIERNVSTSVRTGVATQQEMAAQGEDLLQVRTDVVNTGYTAKEAAGVLRKMAERAFYNRMFLWFLILILFISIILVVYYGYIQK